MKNAEDIKSEWRKAHFPWDFSTCHHCITAHAIPDYCGVKSHQPLIKAAQRILGTENTCSSEKIFRFRKELLALRRKFARFYPKKGRAA